LLQLTCPIMVKYSKFPLSSRFFPRLNFFIGSFILVLLFSSFIRNFMLIKVYFFKLDIVFNSFPNYIVKSKTIDSLTFYGFIFYFKLVKWVLKLLSELIIYAVPFWKGIYWLCVRFFKISRNWSVSTNSRFFDIIKKLFISSTQIIECFFLFLFVTRKGQWTKKLLLLFLLYEG
jgi:hypothetical protein